jgi:Zn-dependent metalloprotease
VLSIVIDLYPGQSGALNEAYSDIIAESIQLLYGMPKQYATRPTMQCIKTILDQSASLRWIIGDQVTLFGVRGLRDMWSPNCNGQPAFVSDKYY